jgi:uncharacterized protein YndB with AHSA1/START domain
MEGTMSNDSFHYEIYIDTTPKRLWRALTDPTKTKKWWNVSFVTDWKVGSTMDVKMGHLTIQDPAQVVLESNSPSRLAYTWHTFTPAWASANGYNEEDRLKFASETRSRVVFDIDKTNGVVRLSLTHDGFDADSVVLEAIRDGWPALLSSLKTFLELGEPLDFSM